MLGEFTGIDILVKLDLHVRVLRNYPTSDMGQVKLNARNELNYSEQVDIPHCEGQLAPTASVHLLPRPPLTAPRRVGRG